MLKLALIFSILWSFYDPSKASLLFIVTSLLIETWVAIKDYILRHSFEPDNSKFNVEELQLIKKYHLYLAFPYTSRSLSSTLSLINLATFFWIPRLVLFGRFWPQAMVIGLNFFIAGYLAFKLNPRLFLHEAVDKDGKREFAHHKQVLESVVEKLYRERQDAAESARES